MLGLAQGTQAALSLGLPPLEGTKGDSPPAVASESLTSSIVVLRGGRDWETMPASQSWILGPTVFSPLPASLQSLPLSRTSWSRSSSPAPPGLWLLLPSGLGVGGPPSSQLDLLHRDRGQCMGRRPLVSRFLCHHSHHIPSGGVSGSRVHLVPKVRLKSSGH